MATTDFLLRFACLRDYQRLTYELMAGYWPTQEGIKNDPVVAAGMNKAEKVVFSRTLDKVDWNNTRLVKDDLLISGFAVSFKGLRHIPQKTLTQG